MTIPEFLDKLRVTEGPWEIVNGYIRCGDNCPITAVGGGCHSEEYFDIGGRLGLDHEAVEDIATAADSDDFGGDLADLRRQLLAATVERP